MNTSLKYIFVIIVFLMLGKNAMAEKIIQTAGRAQLGEFAPEFAHYNDDVLFGENWNNKDIDLKTRSIITVVSLMSMGITLHFAVNFDFNRFMIGICLLLVTCG